MKWLCLPVSVVYILQSFLFSRRETNWLLEKRKTIGKGKERNRNYVSFISKYDTMMEVEGDDDDDDLKTWRLEERKSMEERLNEANAKS